MSWFIVLLVENCRIPFDDPNTHLELTMVHEAMVLEYSGRHLAVIELAASLKLLLYMSDKIGIDGINLMEHHGSEDGYLPQPFTLAAAMAAVTSNVHFSLGAVILPLHDPVMVAEQIAVLDLISGGRCRVIFGDRKSVV